jgi:hypothetical protein
MSDHATLQAPSEPREQPVVENLLLQLLAGLRPHMAASASREGRPPDEFPELDCVRERLPARAIAAAERRAHAVGVTADRVLITSGLLTEEAYVRALAHSLDLIFEPLESVPDGDWLISKDRLIDASAAGLLPLLRDQELVIVVAPRGSATRRLCMLANRSAEWRRRLRLTTGERLTRFVHRNASVALGRRAAFALLADRPDLSAAPRDIPWSRKRLIPVAAVGLGAAITAPNLVATGSSIVLSALFIAWIALRVVGLLAAPKRRRAATPS